MGLSGPSKYLGLKGPSLVTAAPERNEECWILAADCMLEVGVSPSDDKQLESGEVVFDDNIPGAFAAEVKTRTCEWSSPAALCNSLLRK